MNFDSQVERLEDRAEAVKRELAILGVQLDTARRNTSRLLESAKGLGVTAVSIGKHHARVGNEGWKFRTTGSIFTPPNERVDGRPAAWVIAEAMGISQGAGNTGQHQADLSQLVDGVYECRNGEWYRIDLDVSG